MIIFKLILILLIVAPIIALAIFLFGNAKQMAAKKDYMDEQKELSKKYGYRSQEFYERQTLELPKNYFERERGSRR